MAFSLDFWRRFLISPVHIYADFIDPFCYIGVFTFLQVLPTTNAPARWKGFEFNPSTPEGGWALETSANSDLRAGMWASVQSYAHKAGLSFPEPRFISNTKRAHRLVESAPNWSVKKSLIERLYQAYFNDQKDIGRIDVLTDLSQGLAMTERQRQTALSKNISLGSDDTNREKAKSLRFAGMPGFDFGKKEQYFGAIPLEQWQIIFNPTRKETRHV